MPFATAVSNAVVPSGAVAVRIRTGFQQQSCELDAAEVRRGPERPHLRDRAGRDRLEIPAALDQKPHRRLVAAEDREMERAEAVGRELVHARRIVYEQLAQPIDAAEERRLVGPQLLVRR